MSPCGVCAFIHYQVHSLRLPAAGVASRSTRQRSCDQASKAVFFLSNYFFLTVVMRCSRCLQAANSCLSMRSLAHHLLGRLLERTSTLVVQLLLLRHCCRSIRANLSRARLRRACKDGVIVSSRVQACRPSEFPLARDPLVLKRAFLKKSKRID
jgi:hypothetical protein